MPGAKGKSPGVYVRIANPTSSALNPGFDVTPPELITGIITPEDISSRINCGKTANAWDGPGRGGQKRNLRGAELGYFLGKAG